MSNISICFDSIYKVLNKYMPLDRKLQLLRLINDLENAMSKGIYVEISNYLNELKNVLELGIQQDPIFDSKNTIYFELSTFVDNVNKWLIIQHTEWCSHCDSDVIVDWSKGMSVSCPNCGEKLVLCNKCEHQGEDCHLCEY